MRFTEFIGFLNEVFFLNYGNEEAHVDICYTDFRLNSKLELA